MIPCRAFFFLLPFSLVATIINIHLNRVRVCVPATLPPSAVDDEKICHMRSPRNHRASQQQQKNARQPTQIYPQQKVVAVGRSRLSLPMHAPSHISTGPQHQHGGWTKTESSPKPKWTKWKMDSEFFLVDHRNRALSAITRISMWMGIDGCGFLIGSTEKHVRCNGPLHRLNFSKYNKRREKLRLRMRKLDKINCLMIKLLRKTGIRLVNDLKAVVRRSRSGSTRCVTFKKGYSHH